MSNNGRLGIYRDQFIEGSFVTSSGGKVFARVNKVGDRWLVWYYAKHLQRDFTKLRDALSDIDGEFIGWYRDCDTRRNSNKKSALT